MCVLFLYTYILGLYNKPQKFVNRTHTFLELRSELKCNTNATAALFLYFNFI